MYVLYTVVWMGYMDYAVVFVMTCDAKIGLFLPGSVHVVLLVAFYCECFVIGWMGWSGCSG